VLDRKTNKQKYLGKKIMIKDILTNSS